MSDIKPVPEFTPIPVAEILKILQAQLDVIKALSQPCIYIPAEQNDLRRKF